MSLRKPKPQNSIIPAVVALCATFGTAGFMAVGYQLSQPDSGDNDRLDIRSVNRNKGEYVPTTATLDPQVPSEVVPSKPESLSLSQ